MFLSSEAKTNYLFGFSLNDDKVDKNQIWM